VGFLGSTVTEFAPVTANLNLYCQKESLGLDNPPVALRHQAYYWHQACCRSGPLLQQPPFGFVACHVVLSVRLIRLALQVMCINNNLGPFCSSDPSDSTGSDHCPAPLIKG